MFNELPTCPYTMPELRRLCRKVARHVSTLTLGSHTITLHDLHPDHVAAGTPVNEHEHSFYEGHLFLEGGGRYAIPPQRVVGKSGMLLHAPHTPHAWEPYHADCLRLLIWFSIEPAISVTRPDSWPASPESWWEIMLLLGDTQATSSAWEHRTTARISVVISGLLGSTGWGQSLSDEERDGHSIEGIARIVDQFLRDNLKRPIALTDVATIAGMSPRSVCRHFQQATGETIMDRLYNLRMERAATLLADSAMPLCEIACETGMPDPSYFCRRFRQFFNTTPEQYRQGVRSPHVG